MTYSDAAIQTILVLKAVYHLPLRGAQGFVESVLSLIGLPLPVPHFSTLSRRQAGLELAAPRLRRGEAIHLVVDSTGCKVYGEGEWKVRTHGKSKRRTWRKLHLGVNEQSGEIVAAVLSSNNVSDGEALPLLLEQAEEPIAQLSGDGGYDKKLCYEVLQERQEAQGQPLKVTIPPRRGARIWQHGSMATARRKGWRAMKTCGQCDKKGASEGRKRRAQAMETGKRLSPAQPGRDRYVSLQTNRRRQVAGQGLCQTKHRGFYWCLHA